MRQFEHHSSWTMQQHLHIAYPAFASAGPVMRVIARVMSRRRWPWIGALIARVAPWLSPVSLGERIRGKWSLRDSVAT